MTDTTFQKTNLANGVVDVSTRVVDLFDAITSLLDRNGDLAIPFVQDDPVLSSNSGLAHLDNNGVALAITALTRLRALLVANNRELISYLNKAKR